MSRLHQASAFEPLFQYLIGVGTIVPTDAASIIRKSYVRRSKGEIVRVGIFAVEWKCDRCTKQTMVTQHLEYVHKTMIKTKNPSDSTKEKVLKFES